MNTEDYNTVKQHLLHAANILAPNGQVQRAFVRLVHNAEDEKTAEKMIIDSICSGIIDGLRYGNWPGLKVKLEPSPDA